MQENCRKQTRKKERKEGKEKKTKDLKKKKNRATMHPQHHEQRTPKNMTNEKQGELRFNPRLPQTDLLGIPYPPRK